jgi:hypothetical protein
MAVMQSLDNQDHIGRATEKRKLNELLERVRESALSYACFFIGEWGMGKTHLLRTLPTTINGQAAFCPIIDLIDVENRLPRVLEMRLIDCLKHLDYNFNFPAEKLTSQKIETYFEKYYRKRKQFLEKLVASSDSYIKNNEELIKTFYECWNNTCESLKIPIIISFDTAETLFVPTQARKLLEEEIFYENQSSYKIAMPSGSFTNASDSNSYSSKLTILPDTLRDLLDWFKLVLPNLKRTLIVFCSRVEEYALINALFGAESGERALLDGKGINQLTSLGTNDSQVYLHRYEPSVEYDALEEADKDYYLETITQNLPLLLYCYILARRDQHERKLKGKLKDSLGLVIESRQRFEPYIVTNLLNPDAVLRDDATGRKERARRYCLCLLSYARRGITRAKLVEMARFVGLEDLEADVLDTLAREPLVRVIQPLPGDTITVSAQEEATKPERYTLHDAILYLVREYGLADGVLGLSEPSWQFLCETSKQQVAQLRTSSTLEPLSDDLLEAMIDQVVYDLYRDFGTGYRTYTIHVNSMLRARLDEQARLLSDVFWSMLAREEPYRDGLTQPIYNTLEQSQILTIETIRRDEQVRRVRIHYAREEYDVVIELCQVLFSRFFDIGPIDSEGLLTPAFTSVEEIFRQIADKLSQHSDAKVARDPHLYIELVLAWAAALSLTRRSEQEEQAVRMYLQLAKFLVDSAAVHRLLNDTRKDGQPQRALRRDDNLLRLRRLYFLGVTYQRLSQIYYQRQHFLTAVDHAQQSLIFFNDYRTQHCVEQLENDSERGQIVERYANANAPIPSAAQFLSDSVEAEVAHSYNTLALALVESGHVNVARRSADELLKAYAKYVPYYHRALYYTTSVLIYLRIGDERNADIGKAHVKKALEYALQSGVRRAFGVAMWMEAMVARSEMNNQEHTQAQLTPDSTIEKSFIEADKALQHGAEPGDRIELYHDWARYLRDLGRLYAPSSLVTARERWRSGLLKLDTSLELLGVEPSITVSKQTVITLPRDSGTRASLRIADLLATGASLYTTWFEHDQEPPLQEIEGVMPPMQGVDYCLELVEQLLKQDPKPIADDVFHIDPSLYRHVICGKVALQRGRLRLLKSRGTKDDVTPALENLREALIRVLVFGPRHRDEAAFKKVIERTLRSELKANHNISGNQAFVPVSFENKLREFVGLPTPNQQEVIILPSRKDDVDAALKLYHALPYHNPPDSESDWVVAYRSSQRFFRNLVTLMLTPQPQTSPAE